LKAEDATLEKARAELRVRRQPAEQARASAAQTRRERLADEREHEADKRDRIADERERIADEREGIADRREAAADQRERLDDERGGTAEGPPAARDIGTAHERRERDEARVRRDAAALQRQMAAERRIAADAARQTRRTAVDLSMTLGRVAESLDISAVLAEEHAQRQERAGHPDVAAEERRVADGAREAARRARERADVWLAPAADPPDA